MLSHGTNETPSTRLRILQYLPFLREHGVESRVLAPGWTGQAKLFLPPALIYLLRFLQNLAIWRPHVILFQKRLLPSALLVLAHRAGARLVFDFDDAIYLGHASVKAGNKPVWQRQRLETMLASMDHVIAGNEHLAVFAGRLNSRVSVLPTPVDTELFSPRACGARAPDTDRIVVGWIGSSENLWYLQQIAPALREVCDRNPQVSFKVVSDSHLEIPGVRIENKRWALADEASDLCDFDIGIMPLTDDEWSRGKCAFKALLYMAMGLPVVCSPVGMNREVVRPGVNGFFASSPQEWVSALETLVRSAETRRAFGEAGRRIAERDYARTVLEPRLLAILTDLVHGGEPRRAPESSRKPEADEPGSGG